MKSYKGILLLIASLGLTVYAWQAAGMTNFVAPGLALTTLSWTFILATRSRVLEKLFNGIESMYAVHKFLAILSVVLLVFHNIGMGSLWGSRLAAQLGNLGIYTFLVNVSNMKLGVGFIVWFTWHIFLASPTST